MDIFTAEELKAIEFCMRHTITYAKQTIENSSTSDEDKELAIHGLSQIEAVHKKIDKLHVIHNWLENM